MFVYFVWSLLTVQHLKEISRWGRSGEKQTVVLGVMTQSVLQNSARRSQWIVVMCTRSRITRSCCYIEPLSQISSNAYFSFGHLDKKNTFLFFCSWFLCVCPRSLIKANASISDCRCHINQAVPCCRWWRWPSALRPGGGVWGGVANASLTYHYHLASHLFCPTASRSITMPLSHSIPFPFLQGSTKSATIYAPGMNSSSLRPASFTSGALHGNNRRCRDAHPHAGTNHTSYLRVALIPGSVTPN